MKDARVAVQDQHVWEPQLQVSTRLNNSFASMKFNDFRTLSNNLVTVCQCEKYPVTVTVCPFNPPECAQGDLNPFSLN